MNSSSANSSGSAYFNSAVPINGDSSFQSSFQFDLTQASSLAPNAGLLFVVQNNGATAIGAGVSVPTSPGGLKGQYFKNATLSEPPALERVLKGSLTRSTTPVIDPALLTASLITISLAPTALEIAPGD